MPGLTDPPSPPEDAAALRESKRPLPPHLDTPAFRQAWKRWLVHFAEAYRHGKPMPTATADKQLAKLAGLAETGGDKAAIDAIENAITRDLREPAPPLPHSTPTTRGQTAKQSIQQSPWKF
ncbi:hypothetical protein Ga0100231_024020 [Opitutaceae bacterium TAV4]|nr:hypothetical protein Ga0100231_024020 [Opitutaceae bacterium TAV4]RRK00779.1 hypothetical protein Ga0100230_023595 [Opitutaceae bacterium TAV3]